MKSMDMDQKHQQGLKLWNAGKSQECANIWMDLADYGHLDSIEQLVYIFLDQKEFGEVARVAKLEAEAQEEEWQNFHTKVCEHKSELFV